MRNDIDIKAIHYSKTQILQTTIKRAIYKIALKICSIFKIKNNFKTKIYNIELNYLKMHRVYL